MSTAGRNFTFSGQLTAAAKSLTFSRLARFAMILTLGTCAAAQTLATIHDFGAGRDGENPQSGVIFDRKGNLYGSAALGGATGNGSIYSLTPPAGGQGPWTESILHQFTGKPDGQTPDSVLTMTQTGNLFGTTQLGGAKNLGSVFAVIPPAAPGGSWSERVLYSFGTVPKDGSGPNMGLLAVTGSLIGVTVDGGANGRGTVFQLTPSGNPSGPWTETILYSFGASPDGGFPESEPVMDSDGNLYGVTLLGGAHNLGAVYRLAPPSTQGAPWTESVLYSFSGPDGSSPFGRLLLDRTGALFGVTNGGGALEEGTVFKLAPQAGDAWTEEVLYNFSGGSDGGNPSAGVIMGGNGRLFGTASTGGDGGPDFGGVVFSLDPPTVDGGAWTETVLHSFGGPDGFRPLCRLVARNGLLYGTTSAGGLNGTGTVFVLTQ